MDELHALNFRIRERESLDIGFEFVAVDSNDGGRIGGTTYIC